MKDAVIFGAGGLGRETAVLLEQINEDRKQFNLLGFFDDGLKKGNRVDRWEILGGAKELNSIKHNLQVVVAIADSRIRFQVVQGLTNPKLSFPIVRHPIANIGSKKDNHFERGVVLTANTVLTTHVYLGEFVIVNLNTTIGHDARVSQFSSIMPGCSISGNVRIGARCFLGTGSRILQNITLGDDCTVGAGAVVTKDFAKGSMVVGIPASLVK